MPTRRGRRLDGVIDMLLKIDDYYARKFAYLVSQLDSFEEGEGRCSTTRQPSGSRTRPMVARGTSTIFRSFRWEALAVTSRQAGR